MKLHKPRKSMLAYAVATAIGGAALFSASAQAVDISQDGLGQVLVFPYYTVKNGWATYIHLTNTSSETVLAKVRWREARNSREVRDFNIILSPYDMWTAAMTTSGEDGAKILTWDNTCTSPQLLGPDANGAKYVDFTSIGYDGSDVYSYDNGGLGMERMQEGYIEVIAMASSPRNTGNSDNRLEWSAKHVNGVPRDCGWIDAQFAGTGEISPSGAFAGFSAPGNVLTGFTTLINIENGQAMGGAPTTFANFIRDTTLIFPPGDLRPDLSDVQPPARYVDSFGDLVEFFPLGGAVDAISALLMRDQLINEYSTTATGSVQTEWVINFPTKHYYVDDGGLGANEMTAVNDGPFDEVFSKDRTDLTRHNGKSCTELTIGIWDREERTTTTGTQFSPRPASGRNELCWEVNVLSYNEANIFGSGVRHNINSPVGESGWARLRLGTGTNEGELVGGVMTDSGPQIAILRGLPVMGFAAYVRNNAAEAGNNRNYAHAQGHSYVRDESYVID